LIGILSLRMLSLSKSLGILLLRILSLGLLSLGMLSLGIL
jgi:hypothetical protein